MSDLLPVEEARHRILAGVQPLPKETVALDDAPGRVLAEDVVSDIAVPPFPNSAMDGFAIQAADTEADSPRLSVVGDVAAGTLNAGAIGRGQSMRIMTGAPLPDGADAVVPFEDTEAGADWVRVPKNVAPGACIRPAGLDVTPGSVCLTAGTRLSAARIALCASIGKASLAVHRRPVVAILATGDELVEPGTELQPGQIYNSNAYGLAAAIAELGAVPRMLRPAADDPEQLRRLLRTIEGVDLIVSSGGVSVGDYDYVKQVVGEEGTIDFWRIRMRPGKPLMVGTLPCGSGPPTMILGLPGNPTSTMVTFFVFARPVILRLMGHAEPLTRPVLARLKEPLDNRGGRETFFRVRLATEDQELVAYLSGGQDSSMLLPLARANGLARVGADVDRVQPGEMVPVHMFDGA